MSNLRSSQGFANVGLESLRFKGVTSGGILGVNPQGVASVTTAPTLDSLTVTGDVVLTGAVGMGNLTTTTMTASQTNVTNGTFQNINVQGTALINNLVKINQQESLAVQQLLVGATLFSPNPGFNLTVQGGGVDISGGNLQIEGNYIAILPTIQTSTITPSDTFSNEIQMGSANLTAVNTITVDTGVVVGAGTDSVVIATDGMTVGSLRINGGLENTITGVETLTVNTINYSTIQTTDPTASIMTSQINSIGTGSTITIELGSQDFPLIVSNASSALGIYPDVSPTVATQNGLLAANDAWISFPNQGFVIGPSGAGVAGVQIANDGDVTVGGDLSVKTTGGTGVMYVESSAGRVGINDDNPQYTLTVNGTGNFTETVNFDANINGNNGLQITAGGGITIVANAVPQYPVNVAFAEATQALTLTTTVGATVNNLIAAPYVGGNGYNGLTREGDAVIAWDAGTGHTPPSYGLVVAPHTGTAGGIRIDSDGNLGVGVATPQGKLHVGWSTPNIGPDDWIFTCATDSPPALGQYPSMLGRGIREDPGNSGKLTVMSNGTEAFGSAFAVSAGGMDICSALYSSAGPTLADINDISRIFISNSGPVGIGKRNPTYTLDVSGDANISAGLYLSGYNNPSEVILDMFDGINYQMQVRYGGTEYNPYMYFEINDNLPTCQGLRISNNGDSSIIATFANKQANPAAETRVGVGLHNPLAKLHIAWSDDQPIEDWLVSSTRNGVYDTWGYWASMIGKGMQVDNTGAVTVYGSGSGTAYGSALSMGSNGIDFLSTLVSGGTTTATFDDVFRMRLTHDGKLGIGTQTPQTSLEVAGSFNVAGATFHVGGLTSQFYPVLFETEPSWHAGRYTLNIARSPTDDPEYEWPGGPWISTFNFTATGHNTAGGNGADWYRWDYVQNPTAVYDSFLGGYNQVNSTTRVVAWLRGNLTYNWSGMGVTPYNLNSTGITVYDAGLTYAPTTNNAGFTSFSNSFEYVSPYNSPLPTIQKGHGNPVTLGVWGDLSVVDTSTPNFTIATMNNVYAPAGFTSSCPAGGIQSARITVNDYIGLNTTYNGSASPHFQLVGNTFQTGLNEGLVIWNAGGAGHPSIQTVTSSGYSAALTFDATSQWLGVYNSTPIYKLDVGGIARFNDQILMTIPQYDRGFSINGNGSADNYIYLEVSDQNISGGDNGADGLIITNGHNQNPIAVFQTDTGSGGGGPRLGVNCAPNFTLDVAGTGRFSNLLTASGGISMNTLTLSGESNVYSAWNGTPGSVCINVTTDLLFSGTGYFNGAVTSNTHSGLPYSNIPNATTFIAINNISVQFQFTGPDPNATANGIKSVYNASQNGSVYISIYDIQIPSPENPSFNFNAVGGRLVYTQPLYIYPYNQVIAGSGTSLITAVGSDVFYKVQNMGPHTVVIESDFFQTSGDNANTPEYKYVITWPIQYNLPYATNINTINIAYL